MLTVFHAVSHFERNLIAQRTKEGLESARAMGRKDSYECWIHCSTIDLAFVTQKYHYTPHFMVKVA